MYLYKANGDTLNEIKEISFKNEAELHIHTM